MFGRVLKGSETRHFRWPDPATIAGFRETLECYMSIDLCDICMCRPEWPRSGLREIALIRVSGIGRVFERVDLDVG